MVTAVYAAMGREPEIDFVPTPEEIRDKYQYFTEADMSNLKAAGYDKPFTSLEDGVGSYVRDFLAADDLYRERINAQDCQTYEPPRYALSGH